MDKKGVKIFDKLIYKEGAYEIQGAIYEVYKHMGCGFLESVYQKCLEYELEDRDIPFKSQQALKIHFKEKELKQKYVPDLICYDKIIIELKAVKEVTNEHKAQVLNYLKATGMKLGILVNFGDYPKVYIKRIVKSRP